MSLGKSIGFVVALLSASAFSQNNEVKTKDVSCEVEFEFDSTQYDTGKVAECFKGVEDHKLDFFYIYTSASFSGSQAYNQKLSEKRSNAVVDQLKTMYPNVKVEIISGGENVKGKTAKITAILVDERPVKNLKKSISNIKQDIMKWRKHRFSGVVGIVEYRLNDTNYEQIGADYAYLFDNTSESVYYELGLGAYYYSDDDVLDLYSVDVFGGGYYRKGVWQIGARLKAGQLARTDNKENTMNIGGALRLGAEGERFSGFLSYGLYKDLKVVNLSLGIRM